jgi:cell division protein FtsW (lipid II flippase)
VIGPMIDATRNPYGTAYTVLHDAKYSIAGKHLRPRFWHSLLALIIVMLPVLLIAEQPDLGRPYWWAARAYLSSFWRGVS